MLAIVQKDQGRAHRKGEDDGVERGLIGLLAKIERGEELLQRILTIRGPAQIDEPGAIWVACSQLSGKFDGQAGLAGSTEAGDRHDSMTLEKLGEFTEFALASDEGRQVARQRLVDPRIRGDPFAELLKRPCLLQFLDDLPNLRHAGGTLSRVGLEATVK